MHFKYNPNVYPLNSKIFSGCGKNNTVQYTTLLSCEYTKKPTTHKIESGDNCGK